MVENALVGLIVCDKSRNIRLFAVDVTLYHLTAVATKCLNPGSCNPLCNFFGGWLVYFFFLLLGRAWIWLNLCYDWQKWDSMSRLSSSSVFLSSIAQICWYWPYCRSTLPGIPCATNSSPRSCQFSLATTPTLPSFCTTRGTDRWGFSLECAWSLFT